MILEKLASTNFYFLSIYRVYNILDAKQRFKALSVLLLSIFNSLVEVVGLAFVIPVIYLINDPSPIFDNKYIHKIYLLLNCKSEEQFILVLMITLILVFVLKNFLSVSLNYIQNIYSYAISYDFLKSQFISFFQIDYEEYIKKNPSYFARDIAIAPNDFSIKIFIPLVMITNELFVLFFAGLGLLIFNFKILLLLIVTILPVTLITMILTKKKAYQIGEEKNREEPETYKRVYDNVHSFLDIKIAAKENAFIKTAVIPFKKLYNLYVKTLLYQSFPQRIMEVVVVVTIAIAFFIIVFVMQRTSNELVLMLALYATAAYRVMPSADRILKMLIEIRSSEYVLDILKNRKAPKEDLPKDHNKQVETIRLDNISYSYDGKKTVLDNVSLRIERKNVYGLKGNSGSGKTTLVRIIAGLIRRFDGEIRLDDYLINQESETWVHLTSIVQQDPFLLNLTLAENVAFGIEKDKIDENRVKEILEKVQLTDLVTKLEHGIWTEIKDNGKNISGGQKQRVAIARALYNESQLLIMDEATNSLDQATEVKIMQMILEIAKSMDITVLIISHKEGVLEYCNKIFEMENGRLI